MPDASLAALFNDYIRKRGAVFFIRVDESGTIRESSSFADQITNRPLVGTPAAEVFTAFAEQPDFQRLADTATRNMLLHVDTNTAQPATLYFDFLRLDNDVVVLGKIDFREQIDMKRELLTINTEINNYSRQIQKQK